MTWSADLMRAAKACAALPSSGPLDTVTDDELAHGLNAWTELSDLVHARLNHLAACRAEGRSVLTGDIVSIAAVFELLSDPRGGIRA